MTDATTQSDATAPPLYKDFMCVCQPEPLERCERVMSEVCADLEATPESITSAVIYNSQHLEEQDADGNWGPWCSLVITGIPSDMWARIDATVERYLDDAELTRRGLDPLSDDVEEYETIARIEVQCDRLEHGFARLYQLAKQAVAEYLERENAV